MCYSLDPRTGCSNLFVPLQNHKVITLKRQTPNGLPLDSLFRLTIFDLKTTKGSLKRRKTHIIGKSELHGGLGLILPL